METFLNGVIYRMVFRPVKVPEIKFSLNLTRKVFPSVIKKDSRMENLFKSVLTQVKQKALSQLKFRGNLFGFFPLL